MSEHTDALAHEYQEFEREKKEIRDVVGQIGGVQDRQLDRVFNAVFFSFILFLFGLAILQHLFHAAFWFSPIFSLELGVLLVSLKIIWMMHRQSKVEHFQFWILNSIEFRLNEIAKDIREIRRVNEGVE